MTYEIEIQKLAYGGEGLGFVEGKVCFAENALPQEVVRAEITQTKKKFLRGKTIEVIKRSPNRITPICPYIERCGGCQYQHATYEEELKWKDIQAREHLSKSLKISPDLIQKITPSPKSYEYRTSVTLHQREGVSGFFSKDNKSLVPVEHCALLDPRLNAVFKQKLPSHLEDITFRLTQEGEICSQHKNQFISMKINDQSMFVHSRGFFQTNLEVTGLIAKNLQAEVEKIKPETFIDLYSGCGAFTFLAAPSVKQWVFSEENAWSLEALEENLNDRKREAVIISGKVEEEFLRWLGSAEFQSAFLLMDPPRKGLHPSLARTLSTQKSIQQIAYLSCHLGTLTRDLEEILKSGLWKIQAVYPFDMFPRTKHIELLVFLVQATNNK